MFFLFLHKCFFYTLCFLFLYKVLCTLYVSYFVFSVMYTLYFLILYKVLCALSVFILYKVPCTLYVSYFELSVMYTLFFPICIKCYVYLCFLFGSAMYTLLIIWYKCHVHFVFPYWYKVLCTLSAFLFGIE